MDGFRIRGVDENQLSQDAVMDDGLLHSQVSCQMHVG